MPTRAGTPFVELIAVMAKYNPFAERGKQGYEKNLEGWSLFNVIEVNTLPRKTLAWIISKFSDKDKKTYYAKIKELSDSDVVKHKGKEY